MSPKPSDFIGRVIALESQLRTLAADAANDGNWQIVRAACLAAESLQTSTQTFASDRNGGINVARDLKEPTRNRATKQLARKSAYPQFLIENSELVKIGWSKRERAEYRHKAPLPVVAKVAQAITKLADAQGAFRADALFPILDGVDGVSIPDYQGYVALRWFRELGLVAQRGRSGYQLNDAPDFTKNVDSGIANLVSNSPTHRGR